MKTSSICYIFVLVIVWFGVQLTINLTSGNLKFSSLSYHESNLSLFGQQTMRLLVNYQLNLIAMQSKGISLEKHLKVFL